MRQAVRPIGPTERALVTLTTIPAWTVRRACRTRPRLYIVLIQTSMILILRLLFQEPAFPFPRKRQLERFYAVVVRFPRCPGVLFHHNRQTASFC